MKTTATIRLALVDDHSLFREGLRDLLSDEPGFQIAGEASDGHEALRLLSTKEADVAIMDLRMPNMGGVATIRQLKALHPALKIVVVTMYEDDDHYEEAVLAGADAYLSKMDDSKTVADAVRRVFQGEKLIAPARVIASEKRKTILEEKMMSSGVLTEAEHKVLEGLCQGKANKELASEFFMSEKTIKNHLTSVFKKLSVKGRVEAVSKALKMKLVSFTS